MYDFTSAHVHNCLYTYIDLSFNKGTEVLKYITGI